MRILAALLALTMAAHGQGVIPKTASIVDGGHRYDVDTNGKRLIVPEATYTNAVLMLPFSVDDGGDYYDVSLSGNDGAQTTAGFRPAWTNDGGGAYVFDGVDDYIDNGDSDDFTFGNGSTDSPFSIAMWVNMTDATTFRFIGKDEDAGAGLKREWFLITTSADILMFRLFDDNPVINTEISRISDSAVTSLEGQWAHVAATYDGGGTSGGITMYTNGVALASTAADQGSYVAMYNTTASVNLGRLESASSYASGSIDDVRIYSRELSETEIDNIIAQTSGAHQ